MPNYDKISSIKLYKNDLELMEMSRLIQSTEDTLKNAGVDDKQIFKRNAKKMKRKLESDVELYESERKNCMSENKLNELFFYGMSSVITFSQIYDTSLIQFILAFSPYSAELNNHGVDMMLACFLNTIFFQKIGYGKMIDLISQEVFSKLAEKAKEGTLEDIFNIPNLIYTVLTTLIGATTLYILISKKIKNSGLKGKSSKDTITRSKTPKNVKSIVKRKANKPLKARTPRGKEKFEKLMKSFENTNND